MVMLVDMKVVYSFNMSDNIKYTWFGGRRHSGRQGQQGGENQGGCLHQDVSLRLEFSKFFILSISPLLEYLSPSAKVNS